MLGSTIKDCWTLAKWGLKTRLFLLLLQVLLHNVIPDHTGSMEDVFMKTHRSPEHPLLVESLLGGLDNWDAEYFIFNAYSGYGKHEQTMAFSPLLPLTMWILSNTLFLPLKFLIPQRSILLISGASINLLSFPLATVTLYLLTLELSRNRQLSLLATILFTLNPASIFMSAVYSETMFALFTFSGLLALEKRQPWLCSLAFGLASFTRSNGIVLCGFLGYQCLVNVSGILLSSAHQTSRHKLQLCGRHLCAAALQCVVTVTPFYGFQCYGYVLYCMEPSATPTSFPVWCNWTFPFPYSYIQAHYWNVGFLKYYEWKQVPNFLLALPMILLGVFCMWYYFTGGEGSSTLWRRTSDYNRTEHGSRMSDCNRTEYGSRKPASVMTERDSRMRSGVGTKGMDLLGQSSRLRPYMVHFLFLLIFGVLNMHIQVLTRFICSSSPVLYWVVSLLLLRTLSSFGAVRFLDTKYFTVSEIVKITLSLLFGARLPGNESSKVWLSRAVIIYFLVYIFLGFSLHCNFYPWT